MILKPNNRTGCLALLPLAINEKRKKFEFREAKSLKSSDFCFILAESFSKFHTMNTAREIRC